MPVVQTSDSSLTVPRPSLDGTNPNATGGLDAGGTSFATTSTVTAINSSGASWIPNHPYARGGLTSSVTSAAINSNSNLHLGTGSASAHQLSTRPSQATLVNDADASAMGISFPDLDGRDPSEQLETLRDMIEKETRLKEGAVNFLKMDLDVRPSRFRST